MKRVLSFNPATASTTWARSLASATTGVPAARSPIRKGSFRKNASSAPYRADPALTESAKRKSASTNGLLPIGFPGPIDIRSGGASRLAPRLT